MPSSTAPKKIINRTIKKKTASAVKSERADGSTGNGLSKRDRFGNTYYRYWTKECCPEEHRQIVFVNVDATAASLGITSGAWTYDRIRKHSLERLRAIPHYVQFGSQLKFSVSESEARLCDLDPKRTPKGIYGADWVEGSDRDGYYRSVTPGWKQERIEASSPEVYHDLQRAAVMAKFE
jgi:hypothetical protein